MIFIDNFNYALLIEIQNFEFVFDPYLATRTLSIDGLFRICSNLFDYEMCQNISCITCKKILTKELNKG